MSNIHAELVRAADPHISEDIWISDDDLVEAPESDEGEELELEEISPRVTFHSSSKKEAETEETKQKSPALQNQDDDNPETGNDEKELSDFSSDEDELEAEEPKTLKERIFATMTDPSYSTLSLLLSIYMLLVLALSTGTFLASSLPRYYETPSKVINAMETLCVASFTIEYLIKLVSSPVWYKWIIEPLHIIDLIAIIPFYVDLIVSSTQITGLALIRIIRILRIARLFRSGKYSSLFRMLFMTLKNSRDGLILLAFLLSLLIVFFSTLQFFAEQIYCHFDEEERLWIREDGSVSPFQSIAHTFWWCITTLTTTGYGDTYPITWPGKIVAAITMVCGLIALAFPISVIGSNFNSLWSKRKEKIRARIEQKRTRRLRSLYAKWSEEKLLQTMERRTHEMGMMFSSISGQLGTVLENQRRLNQMAEEFRFRFGKHLSDTSNSSKHGSAKGRPHSPSSSRRSQLRRSKH